MKKLSRKIFNECIEDEESLKALALLIFVKAHKATSVIANYSTYKLSKLTGAHKNTIKRRINALADMDLIECADVNNKHLRFKKVRAKCFNINISKIDQSSLKSIELGLKALVIVETQAQKNFLEQQIIKATNPKSGTPLKEIKRAKHICRQRGITKFQDNGISYKAIAKKLNSGYGKVSQAIKYGVEHKMFEVKNNIKEIYKNVSNPSVLMNMLEGRKVFYSSFSHSIYECYANTYKLLPLI